MKKVTNIYFEEQSDKRVTNTFSGLIIELEDGTKYTLNWDAMIEPFSKIEIVTKKDN